MGRDRSLRPPGKSKNRRASKQKSKNGTAREKYGLDNYIPKRTMAARKAYLD